MLATVAMTNVFKIRSGKETHVYRTDQAADKKNLLAQFRQIAEEFAQRRQKEREGEHERRKSLWAGGDVRPSFSILSSHRTEINKNS
jgi:exocyst complex component 8